MPYINESARRLLAAGVNAPITPGELNYAITQLVVGFQQRRGLNYQTINDIVGALEGAKLEFYRRVATPYEDGKIQTNGDVYPS